MKPILKFRAFDLNIKKWIDMDSVALDPLNGRLLSCDDSTFVEYHTNNYKVMQYTGLKDKNNVEIYEGDILKYTSPYIKYVEKEKREKMITIDYISGDCFMFF